MNAPDGGGLPLVLAGGAAARVTETDGDRAVLRSAAAAPPGSIVEGSSPEGGPPYRVKVRGCRRVAEGDPLPFRVEGRFVDLTREQRARVVRSVTGS